MAAEVKVPGIGNVKKTYVYAGAALVVGIVGWAWWSRSQGGDGGSVTYEPDPSTGSATGVDAYGNPAPNPPDPYAEPEGPPRNNQEWTARVLIALQEQGIEPGFASATIGRYLDRRPLTSDEADVVRQAWALMGKPPEGPTTFTLSTDGGSPGSSTPVKPGPPRNLKPFVVERDKIILDWDPPSDTSKPVGGYNVWVTAGHDKGAVFKTKDTVAVLLGRQPDTSYSFRVEAFDPTDKVASENVYLTVRTKK